MNWKLKESSLKHLLKDLPKHIEEKDHRFNDIIKAATYSIVETITDKVLKVFAASMSIFNFLITSKLVEQEGIENFVRLYCIFIDLLLG